MSRPPQPFPDFDSTADAFAAHVNGGKVATFRQMGFDVVMGERSGATFQDAFSDRRWFNCHCNGGVFNLGHRNAKIIEAVTEAFKTLDVGNHHLISGHRAKLAERLAATTGGHLPGVVFGVGGGEATDLAIKVVRAGTGRRKIISATGGYHGHTGLALATGDKQYREPFGPNLPHFEQVRFDDLNALEAALDDDTAAVILETIPATLGMPIPSRGYLAGVERLCHARGAKLILDEVQTGLGRTGKIWAYQHEDVRPDVVVSGKGLSGGVYPITATLMTRELHAVFDQHPFIHISTFGGAEPGCVAALKVLDLIEAPGFLDRVNAVADRFGRQLAGRHYQVRQRGLMMGLKFEAEIGGMMATKALFDAGIFALYANNDPSVLQLLPPLTATDDEVTRMISILHEVLG